MSCLPRRIQEELDINGPQADSQGISSDGELVGGCPSSSSKHRPSSPQAQRLKRKERLVKGIDEALDLENYDELEFAGPYSLPWFQTKR